MDLTRRQNEIVDTALRLTAQGGIQNLTIKNLSSTLGVTDPALYRHFRSKSEVIKAMIGRFEHGVSTDNSDLHGFDAIIGFVKGRIEQVCANPDLARAMFSEEIFMDDPEFVELMSRMMHKHKDVLNKYFVEAQKNGDIRSDIAIDMLFRIVMGPVRLLIKQWGMTHMGFDLRVKGAELLKSLQIILKSERGNYEKNDH